MTNICQITINRIYQTGNQELLNEVTNFLDILELLAKKNQSIFLLSETYWLKAHIATISLEITKAQELFNQAQLIADEFNIQGLASRISADHDRLLEHMDRWEKLSATKETLTERLETARLDEFFSEIFLKEIYEEEDDQIKEEPIVLIILSQSGLPVYSYYFATDKNHIDDTLLSGFLMSINNFIREAFKTTGSIERIKHQEYNISMQSLDRILLCYVFKGQSYFSQKRLSKFIDKLHPNDGIWNILLDLAKSSIPIDDLNEEKLDGIVQSVFC